MTNKTKFLLLDTSIFISLAAHTYRDASIDFLGFLTVFFAICAMGCL